MQSAETVVRAHRDHSELLRGVKETGPLVDLAMGGMNCRIKHHLFPSMPRSNPRRAQPPVRAFCAERGVPSLERTLLGSYGQALRHLRTVGRA